MRIFPLVFVSSLFAAVSACEVEVETKAEFSKIDENSSEQTTPTVDDLPRPNMVNGLPLNVEQAILENGRLRLRQGDEVFADRQIEIVLFDEIENLFGKTISAPGKASLSDPHIIYSKMLEGSSLPDSETSMFGYQLRLSFGTRQALGIPVSINLLDEEHNSSLMGEYFATFGNIKVTGTGDIDASFNSFETQQYLAARYIKERFSDASILQLGTTNSMGWEKPGTPRLGFVGFVIEEHGKERYIKVELQKPANGLWEATGSFTDGQLAEANWKQDYKDLGFLGDSLDIAGAKYLQSHIQNTGHTKLFRGEALHCRSSGHKLDKVGLCRSSYFIERSGENQCLNFAFLMRPTGSEWQYDHEVDFYQDLGRDGQLKPIPEGDFRLAFSECPPLKDFKPQYQI